MHNNYNCNASRRLLLSKNAVVYEFVLNFKSTYDVGDWFLPFIYSQPTNTTGLMLVVMECLISREFNKAYKCHVSIISLPLCSPVSVFHLNFYFSDPRDIIIHIFLSESQRDLQTEPSLMRWKNTIKCLLKTFGKHIDMQLTVSRGCFV